MPMKLPKGFQRRKSSGNALEELPNPPEPSFRILERPEATKSFDEGNTLKRMSLGRPLSAGHLANDRLYVDRRPNTNPHNRGSGGTNNSASSGGHNDNSSSSARFSSSSTLPSSTDLTLEDKPSPNARDFHSIPAPPIPESNPLSLRAAGRALSFGRKKVGSPIVPGPPPRQTIDPVQSDGHASFNRQRAMTESSYASGSTATPPKLLDAGFDLGQSDLDGFGSMFESFGKRQSQINLVEEPGALGLPKTESPQHMSPRGSRMLTQSYFGERSPYTPPPLHIDPSREVQASPRSWHSRGSQEGLMASSSPTAAEHSFRYDDSPPELHSGQGLSKTRTMPLAELTSPAHQKREQRLPSTARAGLQRSNVYASRRDSARDSGHMQDEDARLVMDSLNASQRLNRQSGGLDSSKDSDDEAYNPAASLVPKSPYPSSYGSSDPRKVTRPDNRQRSPGPMFDSSDQDFSVTPWRQESADTTPRAKKRDLVPEEERSLFDTSPQPSARPAVSPRPLVQPPSKPETQNKVMTPAQFEKYRKEQDATRDQYFRHEGSDDEEEEDYEDDDEIERTKQLARQRRKQEAHLAVYRQQMMKVTGEQPSDLPNVEPRPGLDRASMSAPNLDDRSTTPTITFDKPAGTSKASDDEDEDVPLGVLAAHGFPSKNRPPTALGNSGSNIQYKSETYPPPPLSTAGASAAGARGLPPFAKNLPPDPYYGAGLVNPLNRESLHPGPGSSHGGIPPSMPPGGLVGVIAGEERARAARRGSPNAQGNYGAPLPQGMAQMPMGMPPGMPPMMSPGEQATVHMSEQMTQMMQMQMQWMQQMQQMMVGGLQGPQAGQQQSFALSPQLQHQHHMMMSAGMLAPPGQQQRPMSTGSHPLPATPAGPHLAQQRAMSMMGSMSTPPWQPQGNGSTPAAPSMMSGALGGLGPGYTPSIAPSERSNVGMPNRYRPVSIVPADEHAPRANSRASTFTSGTLQPGGFIRNSKLETSSDKHSKLSMRPVSSHKKAAASDDDDEEGWEEMKKSREKKKNMWRLNKKRDENPSLENYDYPNE